MTNHTDIADDIQNAMIDLEDEYDDEYEDDYEDGPDASAEAEATTEALDDSSSEAQADIDQGDTAQEGSAQNSEPVLPPATWSADEKQWFKSLPHEAQRTIAKREKDREAHFTRKSQELAGVKHLHDAVVGSLGHERLNAWQRQGINPAERIGAWAKVFDMLERDPRGAINFLSSKFGVSPTVRAGASSAPSADPRLSQMEQKLNTLSQHYNQQMHQSEVQSWTTVADSVFNEKDEYGDRAFPYAEELSQDIVKYTVGMAKQDPSADKALLMRQAYYAAVAARPDVKQAIDDLKYQQYMQRQNGKASKARRAATAVTSKGAPVGASKVPDDVYDHVKLIADQLG